MNNNPNSKNNFSLGRVPSPPEFLVTTLDTPVKSQAVVEEYIPSSQAKTVDYTLYQNALEDRKQAEVSYAEIYGKYLEVLALNEKIIRTAKIKERYKERVRKVYENALSSQNRHGHDKERAERHQEAVEKAYADLQRDCDGLRATIRFHEERYKDMMAKLGRAEAEMEQANQQFSAMAEEYDNRRLLIEEADRHIQSFRAQNKQMSESILEWQEKVSKARDENLILQNKFRDLELREAGIEALNAELATSLTKAQKQIFELEDKLARSEDESRKYIAALEAEVERYREQKRREALLVRSKKVSDGEEPAPPTLPTSEEPKDQWNTLYNKWSSIIDELTTHSGKLNEVPKTSQAQPELSNELGDIEII